MNNPQTCTNIELARSTDKVLSKKEVIEMTSLSKSTIYSYIKLGIFPAQIKIGLRRVGWHEHEVRAWLLNIVNRRTEGHEQLTKETNRRG